MLLIDETCADPGEFARAECKGRGLVVFASARLDDRVALTERLGIPIRSSEAELLLSAFAQWGAGLVDHVSGDFGLVVHDRHAGVVHAFRDHVGARPLFYSLSGGALRFGAAPDALLARLPDERLNEAFVAAAVIGGWRSPLDETFFRGLKRLPPGHRLSFSGASSRLERFWRPDASSEISRKPVEQLIEEGRGLMHRAVADRIPSGASVGFHLTGGLDSSCLIALGLPLVERAGGRSSAYAWQAATDVGEGPRIAAAVAMSGLEPCVAQLEPGDLDALWRQDWARGPSQWNMLHELAVQRAAARNGVDCMMSGWGGDEAISFRGTGLHAEYLRTGRIGALISLSPRSGPAAAAAAVRTAWSELTYRRQSARQPIGDTFLSRDFLESVVLPPPRVTDFSDCRTAMGSILAKGAVTERLEDWAISGQATGLRYVYPMLDRRVMEFAYRLPSSLFRQGPIGRWFFREMMRGILPEALRCEQSKLETVRTAALIEAVRASYRRLAVEARDRRGDFARAHYFDMDRLIAALENPPTPGNAEFGHLRRAVQFLDFGP